MTVWEILSKFKYYKFYIVEKGKAQTDKMPKVDLDFFKIEDDEDYPELFEALEYTVVSIDLKNDIIWFER